MEKINVHGLVGKNAISMQSGEKLYDKLYPLMKSNEVVELDFSGVSLYASPFFNASIGLLLRDFSVDILMKNLSFSDISDVGRDLLNHVVENAIAYYSSSGAVSKGISDVSSEDGEND